MNTVKQKLAQMGITLPQTSAPAAAYVMSQKIGNTVYISGHIAKKEGHVWKGKLGDELTTEQGQEAARLIAIDLMATLETVADLDAIRIVKLMGLVNSSATFTEQHLVINGASNLLAEVFGTNGIHARSAFGVAQIPLGACVEIELIVEILDA